MLENRNVVDIDAPAHQVWTILTDLIHYGDWNPTIRRVDGELDPGHDVTIHVGPVDDPRTTAAVPPTRSVFSTTV